MKPATALRLRRLPLPPLRDLAVKQPSSGPNIASLDGIRGLALVGVVAAHAKLGFMRGHGAIALWTFFVLSSFLLTLPFVIHPERLREPRRWLHYFARRILRILPPFYLFLPFFGLFLGMGPKRVLEHAIFLRGDLHLWSIPQEVLFYVLIPPILMCVALIFRRGGPGAVAALLVLAVVCNLFLGSDVFALEANGRPSRFFMGVFVLGVATAYAHRWALLSELVARPGWNRALHALGWAALIALILGSPSYSPRVAAAIQTLFPAFALPSLPLVWLYPGSFGALSALVLYATLHCSDRLLGRTMASLPLRALGLVSYSAYLIHIPVLWTLRYWGLPDGFPLLAVGLLTTYAIACLAYTFVERPFLSIRVG